ncbi:hypothetical protein R1sor_002847 [Riccia sorocarpa]|uniref:Expansin n=1 Tax=Riccia sorocarpa TaxID=122646 RepID=A0ABD3GZX2_9MARC
MGSQSRIMSNSVLHAFFLLTFGATIALAGEGPYAAFTWTPAHATNYGGADGSGTMGGACGYGNMFSRGYGLKTAALSYALFNNGLSCGACFEIKCNTAADSRWCYPNAGSVKVTATNSCPPNWSKPSDNGGWCNPPRVHFDLAYPMFTKMAQYVAGIIPVYYRRVKCSRTGGIRFTINGNPYFNLVLVHNVGGYGNVVTLYIKNSKTSWIKMTQNWGANWENHNKLVGCALSFRATLGTGQTLSFNGVTSMQWTNGQTWEANTNFY